MTSSRWLVIGVVVAVANYLAYDTVEQLIGGSAHDGLTMGGSYFLGNHGHLTQVSRAVFEYSKLHYYSLFVTLPLGIVCACLFWVPTRSGRV